MFKANPPLREPLKPEQVKNLLLGRWGSSPGLAFIHVHLSRLNTMNDWRYAKSRDFASKQT
jgi:xylulose-5-phosphate/fructose-6-phosphate phosphoketolase